MSQDDLLSSLNLIFEGYSEDMEHAFEGAHIGKWIGAVAAYFLEGALGLVVTFLLIVTSSDGALFKCIIKTSFGVLPLT